MVFTMFLYEDVITANSAKPVLTASDFQERSNGALPGRPVHINIRFQVCQGLPAWSCAIGLNLIYQVLIIAKV